MNNDFIEQTIIIDLPGVNDNGFNKIALMYGEYILKMNAEGIQENYSILLYSPTKNDILEKNKLYDFLDGNVSKNNNVHTSIIFTG